MPGSPGKSLLPAVSLLLALAAALLPEAALAVAGQITHLSGAVVARRSDGQSRVLSIKSEVREGDIVVTADNSYARMKFADGGEVVLRPNTQLKIDAYDYEEGRPQGDSAVMSLLKGGLRSVTGLLGRRNPGQFRLATPNATIGIRGTHFGALVCNNDCAGVVTPSGNVPANGLHVDVADGVIVLTTQAGSLELKVGDFGYAQSFTLRPVLVPPNQGTRVTLPSAAVSQSIQGGTVGKGGELECQIR